MKHEKLCLLSSGQKFQSVLPDKPLVTDAWFVSGVANLPPLLTKAATLMQLRDIIENFFEEATA